MPSLTRQYGLVFILDPHLSAEKVTQAESSVRDLVARHGGKVLEIQNGGKRKLSYRIKRYSEGTVLQARLELAPSEVEKVLKALKRIDSLLRAMMVQESGSLMSLTPGDTGNGESE